MTLVAFTIDTERDSSHSIKGNPLQATTFCEEEPCFSATEAGLKDLFGLLDELKIPATFFFEAQTALVLHDKLDLAAFAKHEIAFHGFHHEDFAGLKTGIKIDSKKREEIFTDGKKVLQSVFGTTEFGLRIPYMSIDNELLDLASKHFAYDSSLYGEKIVYYNGFCRIPVLEGIDSKGNHIKGFLWPLMEEDRVCEDYVSLVKKAVEAKNEFVVLATHSWHTRITRKAGRLSEKQAEEKTNLVKNVLTEIKKMPGVEFATLMEIKNRLR
ncbi:MAG: polysaccharide deacetylase family protein [Candidatus Micrarchaeota archaeon]